MTSLVMTALAMTSLVTTSFVMTALVMISSVMTSSVMTALAKTAPLELTCIGGGSVGDDCFCGDCDGDCGDCAGGDCDSVSDDCFGHSSLGAIRLPPSRRGSRRAYTHPKYRSRIFKAACEPLFSASQPAIFWVSTVVHKLTIFIH